ncbi:Ig-like domain-containing protein [Prosthecochloris sp. SCSIO W1101]|uniref:Ig-like domain-containing protein n=1 Tax=Prosthecochloris sp. SCSIO W1101 TaxID=2992242 RepID=UPI00223CD3DC|nr:Ig-like domain-containing protein [Prosthecochloris sp. SCSIO W1101]UZJ42238.1 Ig-like domain-containing protein [Prosthecochloris sp. SCSIO W1101]
MTVVMWAVESDPSHGSVMMSSDGTYTYTPDANFNGTERSPTRSRTTMVMCRRRR